METIKSRQDFERVFSRGRRFNHRLVRITVAASGEGGPGRVAFVAPKRLGNAVFRNHCKRVLREAAREAGLPSEDHDVIMFATHATHDAKPSDVSVALRTLLGKAGVR